MKRFSIYIIFLLSVSFVYSQRVLEYNKVEFYPDDIVDVSSLGLPSDFFSTFNHYDIEFILKAASGTTSGTTISSNTVNTQYLFNIVTYQVYSDQSSSTPLGNFYVQEDYSSSEKIGSLSPSLSGTSSATYWVSGGWSSFEISVNDGIVSRKQFAGSSDGVDIYNTYTYTPISSSNITFKEYNEYCSPCNNPIFNLDQNDVTENTTYSVYAKQGGGSDCLTQHLPAGEYTLTLYDSFGDG